MVVLISMTARQGRHRVSQGAGDDGRFADAKGLFKPRQVEDRARRRKEATGEARDKEWESEYVSK